MSGQPRWQMWCMHALRDWVAFTSSCFRWRIPLNDKARASHATAHGFTHPLELTHAPARNWLEAIRTLARPVHTTERA